MVLNCAVFGFLCDLCLTIMLLSSEYRCHAGPRGLRQSGPLHRNHQGKGDSNHQDFNQIPSQNSSVTMFRNPRWQFIDSTGFWSEFLYNKDMKFLSWCSSRSVRCLSLASCRPRSAWPTTFLTSVPRWITLAHQLTLAVDISKDWMRYLRFFMHL